MLHQRHSEWLEARGIDPELATRFGLDSFRDGEGVWLRVPFVEAGQSVNFKDRLTGEKRFRQQTGGRQIFWNVDVITDPGLAGQPLIVTEGEMDALVAIQCGKARTVSVPAGAVNERTDGPIDPENDATKFRFVWDAWDALTKVDRIILAVDGDEKGQNLGYELARRLGYERCLFVTYPDGCKDLNDVLIKRGAPDVVALLDNAKPYPVKGLYRLSDLPDQPEYQGYSTGWLDLDQHIRIVPGTLTVMTGYAGQGKSQWLTSLLMNLMRSGMNIALGSFETAIKPIQRQAFRAAFAGTGFYNVPPHLEERADTLVEQRCVFLCQNPDDDETDFGLEEVLDLCSLAVRRDGVKLVVIDPWNEIEHKRGRDESETEYIGRAIRAFKRFAKTHGVAVWIIPHPAKPLGKIAPPTLYDTSGSAHWANKPDYGLSFYRPDLSSPCVEIRIVKVRQGMPGKMGKVCFRFDSRTSSYRAESTGDDE